MNRSEKLLEAIGQIDDRLILDAEKASGKKKSSRKKVTGFRYRNALAACAVLAICVGIYGLLAKEGLLLSPFGGREESSQQTQITADTAMEMAAVEEEAAAEEALPAEAAEEPMEAAPAEEPEAAVQQRTGDVSGKEGIADGGVGGGQGDGNQASAQSTEAAETDENSETEEAETADEESAMKEVSGDENAENESKQGLEVASEGKPMVMSLRPIAEGVSDNELEQIQDLPASKIEATLMKTSGTDVTVRFSNNYMDATVTYSSMYGLERQTKNGWSSVPEKENVAWVDVGYELEAGQSATETVRLESIFGKLEAGHYRLVKTCTVIAADQTTKEIILYTEFEIL